MTNSLQVAKKAFSVAVAATTILWSVGLSAFLPTAASAAVFGDVIKGTTLSTVYYYGSDGQRYSFPNEKTYFSWYNDFSAVKTISDSELAAITLAGNIVYRPGTRWVKITSDAKVYAVSTSGKIRWIENEATAKGLGSDAWNTHIDDVPDVFFTDYSVGNSLSSPAAGYDGMLWSDGTSKFLVSGTTYQKVTDAGFAANMYKAGSVLMGTGFTKTGLTAGADITAAMANLTDAAQKVTTPTYAVSQNITVGLSMQSPASSTLVGGQAIGNLMALDFSNTTSAPVVVKSLKLMRTGVSADSSLTNVYLFNKYTRLTDSATVSSGAISWNDAGGLFTIPAGGTVTVNARADIAVVSGQTVGLKLASAADVGFVGAFAASGVFPVMGAIHTTATATLGTVSFGSAGTVDATPSPQNDLKVWTSQVTVSSTNGEWLQAFRVRNTGSVNASDINNWRLYVAGVQRGAAVASQDANGYVTFDFSANPIKLMSNVHEFKVVADIIGGTSRTVTVSLRSSADAIFLDNDYQQPILPTTFTAITSSAQTIASGTLLFSKRTDSPSGDITAAASNAVLARYDVKATGEPMKIESLNFNYTDSTTVQALRNGAIYANGSQIGNTTNLCGDDTTTATGCTVAVAGPNASYTTYNFGSSLVVYPGTPVVLEVRADIYDSGAANANITSGNIQIQMFGVAGTPGSTVLQKTTGNYIVPFGAGAQNPGNVLTVKQGSVVLAKNTSYADQTTTKPQTAYKIGSYSITSTSTEPINITGFVADVDGSTSEATGDFNNMYLTYGPAANMITSTVKSVPSLADVGNTFSVDYTLNPNTTIYVNVYSDISASAAATPIITTLSLTGTAKNSGATLTGASAIGPLTGQTVTISAGTFTPSTDGSSPIAFLAAGNQSVVAAKFRFTATNDSYTISEVQVKVPSSTAAAAGVIDHVELYDGTQLVGSAPFAQSACASDNGSLDTPGNSLATELSSAGVAGSAACSGGSVSNIAAKITGMSVPVTANGYKTLTAKLVLGAIGTGAGVSQTNVALKLDSVKYANSQGSPLTNFTDNAANEVNVTKSVPVVTAVDLTNPTLVNGQATELYKFKVTAMGGDVALKQFTLPVSFVDGGNADTMTMGSLKFYKDGADITSSVSIVNNAGVNAKSAGTALAEAATSVIVAFNSEDVIANGGNSVYSVYGTPAGFGLADTLLNINTFSMYLAGDTSDNSTKLFLNADNAASTIWSLDTVAEAYTVDTSVAAANFIWSDSSAAGHGPTGNAATDSKGDWANGYLVLNLDLASETWSK